MSEEDLNEALKRLEKQKEKLSELLEAVNEMMRKIEEQGEVLKEVVEKSEEEKILLEIAKRKKKRCYHYEEGFCQIWYWEENPEGILYVIKSRKFVGKDGKEKWRMDPHPFYCALCQEFKERV
jgi:tRNA G18 (ribose-2'-O)-methylase SpoU